MTRRTVLWASATFMAFALCVALFAQPPARADLPYLTATGTLTNPGDRVNLSGLTGQSSCAFSVSGHVSAIDTQATKDSLASPSWTNISATDYANPPTVQAQPFTPSAGAAYLLSPTSLSTVSVVADAAWSGGTGTVKIACSSAVARVTVRSTGGSGAVSSVAGTNPISVVPTAGNVVVACATCVYTQATATPSAQPNLAFTQYLGASGMIRSGYQFGVPSPAATGDIVAAQSTSTGQLWLCGSATVKPFCNIDFDVGGGNNRLTVHGHLRILSDIDTYGGAITLNPINQVPNPTLSFTPGGTLPQTTYFVRVSGVSIGGDVGGGNGGAPSASNETSITVPANNVLVVTTASNVGSSTAGFSPNANNVYVSTTSGNYSTGLQTAGITPGSVWTEPTTGLVAGAALPSTDNSAGIIESAKWGLNAPICSGNPELITGYNSLSNNCASTTPFYAGLELPAPQFSPGALVGITTAVDGNSKLVQAAVSPCPTASCVAGVSVDEPLIETTGPPFINIAFDYSHPDTWLAPQTYASGVSDIFLGNIGCPTHDTTASGVVWQPGASNGQFWNAYAPSTSQWVLCSQGSNAGPVITIDNLANTVTFGPPTFSPQWTNIVDQIKIENLSSSAGCLYVDGTGLVNSDGTGNTACGAGTITAGSNVVVTGPPTSPTVAVTAAPVFAGATIGSSTGCAYVTTGVFGTKPCGAVLTTAGVVIPAVNSSVSVPIFDGSGFATSAFIQISDGTHAFIGQITAGGGTTSLTVKNLLTVSGVAGNTVTTGALVASSGSPGSPVNAGTNLSFSGATLNVVPSPTLTSVSASNANAPETGCVFADTCLSNAELLLPEETSTLDAAVTFGGAGSGSPLAGVSVITSGLTNDLYVGYGLSRRNGSFVGTGHNVVFDFQGSSETICERANTTVALGSPTWCLNGLGQATSTARAVTCSSTSGTPCSFTWSCSIASGFSTCNATHAVPSSSSCDYALDDTGGAPATPVDAYRHLVTTTLTIDVVARSVLGAGGETISGGANCQ